MTPVTDLPPSYSPTDVPVGLAVQPLPQHTRVRYLRRGGLLLIVLLMIGTVGGLTVSMQSHPPIDIRPVIRTQVAEHLVRVGMKAEGAYDLPAAKLAYDAALRYDPTLANGYYWRGTLRMQMGDPEGGKSDHVRAAHYDPSPAKRLYHEGRLASIEKRYPEALTLLKEAIDRDPTNDLAFFARAQVWTDLGDWTAAIADYTQALTVNPRFVAALYNRGILESQQGQIPAALRSYTTALQIDPHFANAAFNRGFLYRALGDLDSAITDYTTYIQLRPAAADGYSERGYLYLLQEKYPAAIDDLTDAMRHAPENAHLYCHRAHAHLGIHAYDAALTDALHAVAVSPGPCSYGTLGDVYYAQRDYTQAFVYYEHTRTIAPNNPIGYLGRGRVFHAQAQYADALAEYDTALIFDARSREPFMYTAQIHSARGHIFNRQAQYTAARSAWEDAVDTYQAFGQHTKAETIQRLIDSLRN